MRLRLTGVIARHMIAKVFLAVALVVGLALLVQAITDAHREAETLRRETNKSADSIARIIIGVVEHSMLEGDGLKVKELIADVVKRVPEARVQVFDQRGIEVFAPRPPPPPPADIPPRVAATLADQQRRVDGDVIHRPIRADDRCAACHSDGAALRGVLAIEVDRAACVGRRDEALVRLVESGFIHVMTAGRADLLDDYFAELSRVAPSVRGAAVFDATGEHRYGAETVTVSGDELRAVVAAATEKRNPQGGGALVLVPLPMQDRCVQCHKRSKGVRGVLALSLAPAFGETCQIEELEGVIETSLRYIMLSQLGRRIADFLDASATTGAVRRLDLYDNAGRRYWTTSPAPPPSDVASVLASGHGLSRPLGEGDSERTMVVEPLENRAGCMRCHGGARDDRRGAVSVSLSTRAAAEVRDETLERRAWFSGGTLLAILIILVGVLQYFVLRPVREIGGVADAVAGGNLGVSVVRADAEGDEVARLGHRMNHMVSGLRTKLHLEKFVSRGTAEAAEMAGLRGMARQGERRAATVLFSDIRGFTTFSETVPPERVVDMLNRVLDAQARLVTQHGGDIDKFVGDELMAVFQGEGAEQRAVRCAVAMVAAVHDARVAGENLGIGVGIACGEVVYGAMGSEHRMDHTVIGDVVNTGARLCSAADVDQVLVTQAVERAAGGIADIEFAAHEPLQVKGKRDPLVVFEARRRRS